MRLFNVIKKEFRDIKRDKGFIITLILEPLILILVFGYTFQADITNLNTIVIDDDNSIYSENIINSIENSDYFKIINFNGEMGDVSNLLNENNARALFYIPNDLKNKLDNATEGEIYLYIESSDYTIYNILKGASGQIVKDSLHEIVKIIVTDLESERDLKQKRVDEIQYLVDSIDFKANLTLSKVEILMEQFETTRNLIIDTENKINKTNQEIDIINIDLEIIKTDLDDSLNLINELIDEIYDLKDLDPNSTVILNLILDEVKDLKSDLINSINEVNKIDPKNSINVSQEYFNINQFHDKLDKNEIEVNSIDEFANEINEIYRDIQIRMDSINLELRTLKKEFLSSPLDLKKDYLYGEISYFQYLTPAILTLILFFIGVVLTTVNIVDERNNKTLFRVSTTPLKKWEFFGGKFIVFFIIGIIEAIYVLLLAIILFNVSIVGNIFSAFIVLILLMAASIGLGLLVSSVVKSMRQAIMLVPLVIIPAVLISQTFSPIEVMPKFMQYVSYISPMLYSNVALREIMIKGTNLIGVMSEIIILSLYALVTLILGIILYKKRIE